MKKSTGFWIGMSAGLMAGAAMGLMTPAETMKTEIGKNIQKLGTAVDHAADAIASEMH